MSGKGRGCSALGPPETPIKVTCTSSTCNSKLTNLQIEQGGRTSGQRVFTMGIGANVSRDLVNNVARAGCGVAGRICSHALIPNSLTVAIIEFALEGERLESKVLRLLRYAVQPSAEDVEIDWGSWANQLVGVVPKEVPPIFNGHLQHLYGILKKDSVINEEEQQNPVVVRMRMPPHEGTHEFTISLSEIHTDSSRVIVKLAARARIRQLQTYIDALDAKESSHSSRNRSVDFTLRREKDQLKKEIIELSIMYALILTVV